MAPSTSAHNAARTVVVAGATGVVGSEILAGLLDDDSVQAVHALGRRKPLVSHPKLTAHVVDFAALPSLPPVDEAYLALGTTRRIAGSPEAFRAVDFDANLAVARAALTAGARRAGLVSAIGANSRSRFFYNRVKGELEDALAELPFLGLVIARPSLLLGNRRALGQPRRPTEKLARAVVGFFGPLVPANVRTIAAGQVAQALLARVPITTGREVLLSGEMRSRRA